MDSDPSDRRLRGNDVVLSFDSQIASISVRSILLQTFCDSLLRATGIYRHFSDAIQRSTRCSRIDSGKVPSPITTA